MGIVLDAPMTAILNDLVRDWHEAGREFFQRQFQNLDYDGRFYQHHWKDRKKYIALDQGDGGIFLIDKENGNIYAIKAYGVPNKRKLVGNFYTVKGADLFPYRGR